MGNGALAIGPKLPRPSSTLPQETSKQNQPTIPLLNGLRRCFRVGSPRNENVADTLQDNLAPLITQPDLVAQDAPIGFRFRHPLAAARAVFQGAAFFLLSMLHPGCYRSGAEGVGNKERLNSIRYLCRAQRAKCSIEVSGSLARRLF